MKMVKIMMVIMSILFLLGGEVWAREGADVSRPRTTTEKSVKGDKSAKEGTTRLSGRREPARPSPGPTVRMQAPHERPRDRFDTGRDSWHRGY